jgi:hypothetical protein
MMSYLAYVDYIHFLGHEVIYISFIIMLCTIIASHFFRIPNPRHPAVPHDYTSSAITGKGLFDSILLKSIPLIPLLLLTLFI